MAKQSNTIGHILIELNTAVNVTCHWSDKNRVQGKSPLKPFECVYIATVWKFFAPSASDIFFLLFLHTILFTVENTCRTLTIVVRNLTHVHTQAHPLCTFFLGSGHWVSFPNPYTRGMFEKVTSRTGKLPQVGDKVIWISCRQCYQQAYTSGGIQTITAFKTGYVSGKQNQVHLFRCTTYLDCAGYSLYSGSEGKNTNKDRN